MPARQTPQAAQRARRRYRIENIRKKDNQSALGIAIFNIGKRLLVIRLLKSRLQIEGGFRECGRMRLTAPRRDQKQRLRGKSRQAHVIVRRLRDAHRRKPGRKHVIKLPLLPHARRHQTPAIQQDDNLRAAFRLILLHDHAPAPRRRLPVNAAKRIPRRVFAQAFKLAADPAQT
jgi:hypothetical protein